MANAQGTPIWYEYLATDVDAAGDFYAAVNGWAVADSGMPGTDYRILTAPDGGAIGGLMPLPAGAPMQPGWIGYFGVDDVDAAVDRAVAAGGSVHMPAMTIDGVGRMALLADPQGAPFYVMRGASDAESTSFRTHDDATGGHVVWNELTAADQDAVMAFYHALLGWRHEGEMPMGELGAYKFVHVGPVCIGASMNAPPGASPGWRFYTMADDIDAAIRRVADAGGRVVQGPDPIPGGGCSLVAEDPSGARFGIVGRRNAA